MRKASESVAWSAAKVEKHAERWVRSYVIGREASVLSGFH